MGFKGEQSNIENGSRETGGSAFSSGSSEAAPQRVDVTSPAKVVGPIPHRPAVRSLPADIVSPRLTQQIRPPDRAQQTGAEGHQSKDVDHEEVKDQPVREYVSGMGDLNGSTSGHEPGIMSTMSEASYPQIKEFVDGLVGRTFGLSPAQRFTTIVDELPGRIPRKTKETVLKAVKNGEPGAHVVYSILHLRAALAGAERIETRDRDDLLQEVVANLHEIAPGLDPNTGTQRANALSYQSGSLHVNAEEGIPGDWSDNRREKVLSGIEALRRQYPYGMTEDQIRAESERLAVDIGDPNLVQDLVRYNNGHADPELQRRRGAYPPPKVPTIEEIEDAVDLERVVDTVTDTRGKRIIGKRIGLFGELVHTLDEIAASEAPPITSVRARQIYNRNIEKINKSGLVE